jgi:DNA-binding transcriptional LysR family regulator
MEIRVLRYFLTIAREENMTRASERLHISQPSLSKEIKKLEEELGHELFIRTNKNMLLNDEGMLLRKRAEDILEW